MSTPFAGFTGPTYSFEDAKYATVERCINWYTVPNEGSDPKTKLMLAPSPGNAPFSTLPVPAPFNQPGRGMLENRGVAYGVSGTIVWSISATGAFTNIGTVISDGKPVSMVANGNGQIFIASAGHGYVIPNVNPPDGSLQTIGGEFLGASYATFQDGYILVVTPNTNQFQISGDDDNPIGDATKWSAANVSVQAGQADKLRAIISSREYVRLLGARRSQIYYNVGNNGIGNFPFQSYNETFIETGIAAPFSLVDLGDSLIWIGEDARGVRACWRDAAFQPQRASNFSVEQKWQDYAFIDDAVAFPFIWRGHLMYQITFPRATPNNPVSGFPLPPPPDTMYTGATWVYDVTASTLLGKPIWHERSYQTAQGFSVQRSEMFHCFAYGKHLVLSSGIDGNPGAVYQYSDSPGGFYDCGTDIDGTQMSRPIVRTRITPHVWDGFNRIIVNRLQLECSRGVGLDGSPVVGADPQIYLEVSRDGGNTWGNQLNAPLGRIGQYSTRVLFNRLGYGRDFVFRLTYSDPTYISITAAELDAFVAAS